MSEYESAYESFNKHGNSDITPEVYEKFNDLPIAMAIKSWELASFYMYFGIMALIIILFIIYGIGHLLKKDMNWVYAILPWLALFPISGLVASLSQAAYFLFLCMMYSALLPFLSTILLKCLLRALSCFIACIIPVLLFDDSSKTSKKHFSTFHYASTLIFPVTFSAFGILNLRGYGAMLGLRNSFFVFLSFVFFSTRLANWLIRRFFWRILAGMLERNFFDIFTVKWHI